MKVLHILDHSKPYFSGYAFRSDYILQNLRAHGIDVVVLTSPKHNKMSEEIEVLEGIKYYRINWDMNSWRFFSKPYFKEFKQITKMTRKILSVARSEKVDVIHAHSPSLNGLPAYCVSKKLKIPVIYDARAFWEDAAVDHGTFSFNSFKYKISRFIETQLFKKVNWVFTICESMKSEIVNRGCPEDKVTIIPNGVDVEKFVPMEPNKTIIEKYGLKDKFILGFIGSFYHYEGVEDLVKLMMIISSDKKNVRLLLVGGGPDFNKINNLILENNLTENIVLTGKVPHTEILDYYSVIDVLIYPRKKIRLTELVTPLKPLEAMAMEKIVIGSDVGGIKELITDGENGLIFSSGDLQELRDIIYSLMKNKKMFSNIKKNARQEVLTNRNWFNITKNYVDTYNFLLNKN